MSRADRIRLQNLRSERSSILERIEPGALGVSDLRARLRIVTHEIMALELKEAVHG